MTKIKKRWQFAWCDEDSPPANGDCHTWRTKTFIAPTFEKAMDKMLSFIKGQRFTCLVDYECCALHVDTSKPHEEVYPRIDTTNHELRDYRG